MNKIKNPLFITLLYYSSKYFMRVQNGYSFINPQHIKNHYFLIPYNYDLNHIINDIKNYNPIYISMTMIEDFKNLIPLFKALPNNKFILGGTFYKSFEQFFPEILEKLSNVEIITTLAETYFDGKEISDDYNFFVEKELSKYPELYKDKEILFSYNTNEQCYWNKCKFCLETCDIIQFTNKIRNIKNLLYIIEESFNIFRNQKIIYSLISPAHKLRDVKFIHEDLYYELKSLNKNIEIFIRADKFIVNYFKNLKIKNLSNIKYKIGVESFSQTVLDFYNKNLKVDNIYELLKYLIIKNASIYTSFILNFPEITQNEKKIYLQYLNNLKNIKNINKNNQIYIGYANCLEIYKCTENLKKDYEKYYQNKYNLYKHYLYPTDEILNKIYYECVKTNIENELEFNNKILNLINNFNKVSVDNRLKKYLKR